MRKRAAIIDIDGTLADASGRMHFLRGERGVKSVDLWRLEIDKDLPNQWCIDLVKGLRCQDYEIIYLTGRSEECRLATREWLSRHLPGSESEQLFMRPSKDNRPDTTIKQEIYMREIVKDHCVVLAVDDRAGIAKMWRNLGVTCLHCAGWEEDEKVAKEIQQAFQDAIDKGK